MQELQDAITSLCNGLYVVMVAVAAPAAICALAYAGLLKIAGLHTEQAPGRRIAQGFATVALAPVIIAILRLILRAVPTIR